MKILLTIIAFSWLCMLPYGYWLITGLNKPVCTIDSTGKIEFADKIIIIKIPKNITDTIPAADKRIYCK